MDARAERAARLLDEWRHRAKAIATSTAEAQATVGEILEDLQHCTTEDMGKALRALLRFKLAVEARLDAAKAADEAAAALLERAIADSGARKVEGDTHAADVPIRQRLDVYDPSLISAEFWREVPAQEARLELDRAKLEKALKTALRRDGELDPIPGARLDNGAPYLRIRAVNPKHDRRKNKNA